MLTGILIGFFAGVLIAVGAFGYVCVRHIPSTWR